MSVLLEKTISLLKASPVTLIDLAKEPEQYPQRMQEHPQRRTLRKVVRPFERKTTGALSAWDT
jgi:hypothetical protein